MDIRKKIEPDKSILYKKAVFKSHIDGKIPNLLVGTYGYPFVNVGTLVTEQSDEDAKQFAQRKATIPEIIESRFSHINSKMQAHIKTTNRYTEDIQDVAKSKVSVDGEVDLEKPVSMSMGFSEASSPHGPSALLKNLSIGHARIPRPIARLTNDTDVLAKSALLELQVKKFDEYYLTKLLTAGTLGKNRKLVPTKWSITAVDDTLGENLRKEILDYQYHDSAVFTGGYLGNEFIIAIYPGPWSFELIEVVLPGSVYNKTSTVHLSMDHEFTQGRKKYAEQTAGGYYASKLPILQFLSSSKRQGRVIIFRMITKEYTHPLGVWVVREAVRVALTNPEKTENPTQLAKSLIKKYTRDNILKYSVLLKERQTSIFSFS